MQIVRTNVRQPDEVIGDFYAQTACNDAGGRAMLEMIGRVRSRFHRCHFGRNHPPLGGRGARRDRKLPDGEWRNETWSDGFEEPIVHTLCGEGRAAMKSLSISPALRRRAQRGINIVFNYTHAYASFAIKAAICPDVPHNEGSFRPVHVSAPQGRILNASIPRR